MYTLGNRSETMLYSNVYGREILDPEGDVICYVIETESDRLRSQKGKLSSAQCLIDHLNRS